MLFPKVVILSKKKKKNHKDEPCQTNRTQLRIYIKTRYSVISFVLFIIVRNFENIVVYFCKPEVLNAQHLLNHGYHEKCKKKSVYIIIIVTFKLNRTRNNNNSFSIANGSHMEFVL